MTSGQRGWIFAVLAILCWATVATAFKLTLRHIDFLPLVFWSSLFSTFMLIVLALVSARLRYFGTWSRRDLLLSAGLGALNPAIYYLLLFKAYALLPAQQAQVLNFILPVVLTLLSVLLYKERVYLAGWLALSVSFAGVVLIATQGQGLSLSGTDSFGVFLALSSALVWAFYWLMARVDQQDPVLRLLMNFVFGSLWMAVVMTVSGGWSWPSAPGLVGSVYIALFEMSLAFFFWLNALKAVSNTVQLSNLIFITPFLSLLVITLVLGEQIRWSTLAGLVLIIVGIVVQRMSQNRSRNPV